MTLATYSSSSTVHFPRRRAVAFGFVDTLFGETRSVSFGAGTLAVTAAGTETVVVELIFDSESVKLTAGLGFMGFVSAKFSTKGDRSEDLSDVSAFGKASLDFAEFFSLLLFCWF